jgi:hypothetical protein
MSHLKLVAVTALLGVSCTWQGTPVPIVGPTESLEGQWDGAYFSQQTGRTGSILFRLNAGTDSAFGDVVMVPAQEEEIKPPVDLLVPQAKYRNPRLLRISFVQCEPGRVSGRLDPYLDPETGERVVTTFEGRQRGDTFEGTFSSLYPGSGRRVTGEWSAKREKQ